MTGYVADLSWKSGARAIEKLDRLRSTLTILTWIIKSTKVDYGSECVKAVNKNFNPNQGIVLCKMCISKIVQNSLSNN